MEPDNSDDPDDIATLAGMATALADAVEAALPAWVERCVASRAPLLDAGLRTAAAEAGRRAAGEIGGEVRELLCADVDEQRANPLALLRRAVRYPTDVLRSAAVPPVPRDDFAERAFPDDVYDLSPATWADIDPGLQERGIVWGAAKAHVVLARRRREGKR